MKKEDPFGFDMSVSSAKKKKPRGRRSVSGAVETSTRPCHSPGCTEPGAFRAPKSPDELDQYVWFCKEHIREYNLKWNFFENSTEADVEEQADKDRVWERETKPFGKQTEEQRAWARLGIEDPHQVLGANATRNPGRASAGRKLPPTERRAIEILDAGENATKADLRKAYKTLLKVLHPDMNGGDRSQEEQLTEVVWAWDQLKNSRNFK